MSVVEIDLTVNGVRYLRAVEPRMTLADFVRDELRLTGTHLGCEHGVCGACTVMVDGSSVRACLMLAVQAAGSEVVTVEGLDEFEETETLRTCFSKQHGLQCGFCTPGFLVGSVELLRDPHRDKPLTECAVREALSGHVCRCTGYMGIVQAVLDAAGTGDQ
ncbi:(2Fe-2S)-binding protein [Rhodococcus fascians]|nr:(2Fe-2S)-binding protein [Rhodococcus fascians]MBY4237926.1 (2Fe-2S)-binding protein [Rhodococcus fascians]MBY4253323.1 (2Fe-2S)-binding protein [Rhodococcus fascians]MBY4268960.1 (2Fe-2S)-binding protein [Rhodococcus fascians]